MLERLMADGQPARRRAPPAPASAPLQVLPGVGHRVDGTAGLGAVLARDQGPDVDDPLALLAGDPSPVLRVCGVRQVLLLPHLIDAGGRQVGDPDALLPGPALLLASHILPAV